MKIPILKKPCLSHSIQVLASVNTIRFIWSHRDFYRNNIQSWSTYPNLHLGYMVAVGLLFPMHFASLGAFACKKKQKHWEMKKKFSLKYSSSTESLRNAISHFDQKIEQSQQIHVDFLMLMKKNWLSECLLDNFPSSILMLSIWMLSMKQQRLKLFLDDTFKEFISVNYQIIVGVITSKSALGAVFSALNIRYRPCKILLKALKAWLLQKHTQP